ncbi:hypothetical protein K227x_45070 [Rubripirellula lacrimiformis]|uniref:Uncharacterized protein n=1 Tax=Rubripirellula lacrimiformis TaxID=1930273 RepID=A0A517NG40_9BACT|nr:hypothetical protein [Rubripirellula lacrimiformis]QDT06100.1 hypothetical protein K227x_45070 [Rubripirellula lacrimiformis]
MSFRSTSDERSSVSAGCVFALGSALITSLMLFVNGSLVMAVISAMQRSGPDWANHAQLSQFLLYTLPVVLVVIEWMMIDYLRTRFSRRRS